MQVLRDNKIGREGAVAVCDLMLQNRCITKLDLSGQKKKTQKTSECCWITLLMMVRWRREMSEEVREHNDDNGTTN